MAHSEIAASHTQTESAADRQMQSFQCHQMAPPQARQCFWEGFKCFRGCVLVRVQLQMRQKIWLSQKLALGFKREGTLCALEGAPLMNLEAIKRKKKHLIIWLVFPLVWRDFHLIIAVIYSARRVLSTLEYKWACLSQNSDISNMDEEGISTLNQAGYSLQPLRSSPYVTHTLSWKSEMSQF